MGVKEQQPNPEQIEELAQILGDIFVQRWDLYARQLDDSRYVCIREPLTQAHLEAHLRGDITLGTYVLDAESNGRFMVLDADNDPDWRRLVGVSQALHSLDTVSYLEHSRRGGHLWLFFTEPRPGREIRAFGKGLLTHSNIDSVELFPKQDQLKSGPGSLVRLPFGVHQRSGQPYGFYDTKGRPLASALSRQIMALEDREMVPGPVFERFRNIAAPAPVQAVITSNRRLKQTSVGLPSERIKKAVPLQAFVAQYVELSASGTGCCPFHDDNSPSFSVNEEEGYWHCFACEKGGSVIDFYMALKNCDFQTAIRDLVAQTSVVGCGQDSRGTLR
jgi:hypothetical protein